MSSIEKVTSDILEAFREGKTDVGQILDANVFARSFLYYNPVEKAAIDPAIDALATKGIVERRGEDLVLTQTGMPFVYGTSREVQKKVQADILEAFREGKTDVGQILDANVFARSFLYYNPAENAAMDPAIDALATKGIVERRGGDLVLTQAGMPFVYGSTSEVQKKVQADIFEAFRKGNTGVGQILDANVFAHSFLYYNPAEKAAMDPAIDALVTKGIVERRGGDIVLTKAGLQVVYNA